MKVNGCVRKYNGLYDAYYCERHNHWLEPVCYEPGCTYCTSRPEHPLGQ